MGTSGLGALLVDEGLLTEADRRTIRRTCGSHGPAFARSVIALGLLDEDELAAFLAEKTQWRVAPKELFKESRQDVWGVVDRPLVERLEVLPLKLVGSTLHVAMVDPLDQDTLKQLAFFTGYKIHPVISTLTLIRQGLTKLFKDYKPASSSLEEFLTNHALSAGRRLKLLDGRAGARRTSARVPQMIEVEAADPGEPAARPVTKSADTWQPAGEDSDDGELMTEDDSHSDLEYPDSVTAAEDGVLASEKPAAAGNEAVLATPVADSDPAGLDGLEDLEGGDLGSLDEMPAEDQKADAAPKAEIDLGDDLEGLADLNEFDPDGADGTAKPEDGSGLEELGELGDMGDIEADLGGGKGAAKADPLAELDDVEDSGLENDLTSELSDDALGELGDLGALVESAAPSAAKAGAAAPKAAAAEKAAPAAPALETDGMLEDLGLDNLEELDGLENAPAAPSAEADTSLEDDLLSDLTAAAPTPAAAPLAAARSDVPALSADDPFADSELDLAADMTDLEADLGSTPAVEAAVPEDEVLDGSGDLAGTGGDALDGLEDLSSGLDDPLVELTDLTIAGEGLTAAENDPLAAAGDDDMELAADLGSTDLDDTELGTAELGSTDLDNTDLRATDPGSTDLGATDLGALDLGSTDLDDTDLGATALGTDLDDTDLGAADLASADLGNPGLRAAERNGPGLSTVDLGAPASDDSGELPDLPLSAASPEAPVLTAASSEDDDVETDLAADLSEFAAGDLLLEDEDALSPAAAKEPPKGRALLVDLPRDTPSNGTDLLAGLTAAPESGRGDALLDLAPDAGAGAPVRPGRARTGKKSKAPKPPVTAPVVDDRTDDDLLAAAEENLPADAAPSAEPPSAPLEAGGDADDDPLAVLSAPDPKTARSMQHAASLNRALLTISLASDAHEGMRKAADALVEAGLTRGVLIALEDGTPRPVSVWESSPNGTQTRKDGLAALVTPGLNVALARLYAGWAPFGEGVRDSNLKPFTRWLDKDHKLMAAAVPVASGKQLAVVVAWHSATRDDAVLRPAALELFRRLALKKV